MSLFAHKLVACLVLFAVALTGVVCACDHGVDDACAKSSVATSPCHHAPGAVDAHQANDPNHDQDHDPGHDQDQHDGCTCATTIVSAPGDQAGGPSLRPALVAQWDFAAVTAPLPLALGPALVHSEPFLVALPHLHRAATSLLRQHCALII
jgi:hypothetical protein